VAGSLGSYEPTPRRGGTLFDRMTPDMRICKEEIFGPVLEHAEGRRIRHAYGQVTLDPAGGV
jgi:hypothetical protein